MFAGKKSAQIREILISESAWEEMTCLFAPSLSHEQQYEALALNRVNVPFTWKRNFSEVVDEDGVLWLEGKQNQDGWIWQGNNIVITYTRDEGMTRVIPANPK